MIGVIECQNLCTYSKLTNTNSMPVENFMIICICTLVFFEVCVSESIPRVKK